MKTPLIKELLILIFTFCCVATIMVFAASWLSKQVKSEYLMAAFVVLCVLGGTCAAGAFMGVANGK